MERNWQEVRKDVKRFVENEVYPLEPVLQKKGELIMPLQGLIRADAQIKNVLNQLTEKGVLKKKDEEKTDKKMNN